MIVNKLSLIAAFYSFIVLSLSPSWAGVFTLSSFSRANCINNESITWDATKTWQMLVWSQQYEVDLNHYVFLVDAQWDANRAAAVCWGCGLSGNWEVGGVHVVTIPTDSKWGERDEEGKDLLEMNCEGWLYTGDGDFSVPCNGSYATGCNATDWRGTKT